MPIRPTVAATPGHLAKRYREEMIRSRLSVVKLAGSG